MLRPVKIGQTKIALNGFMYYNTKNEKTLSPVIEWDCIVPGCSGGVFTDLDCVTSQFTEGGRYHIHPPDFRKVAEERTVLRIKEHLQSELKPMNEDMLQQLVEKKMGEEEAAMDKEALLKRIKWWRRALSSRSKFRKKSNLPVVDTYDGSYPGDQGDNVLELLTSQKGNQQIILNGFMYLRHGTRIHQDTQTVPWRCKVKACRGKAKTDLACLHAEAIGYHNHPPDHIRAEVSKMRIKMMKLLTEEDIEEGQKKVELVKKMMAEVPEELVPHMPKLESLMRRGRDIQAKKSKSLINKSLLCLK